MMDPAPKIPSSAYKSSVPQPNGQWDAQVYENHPGHHPLWLRATCFETENEAATTAAAAMFRAPHGTLNFHPYQEDTNTYDEDDPDEQIVEERGNIEEGYRDDDRQEQGAEEERQQMFEKPLTPSDVGKLNRLVIPKQHAERYFPLGGGGGGGGESGEKGLLLSFEDESGKAWRFRYSYWNSSQSYVLTKGWSRFVKEKRLGAGDVVSFDRHRVDAERFYIRWRRRAVPVQDSGAPPPPPQQEGISGMDSWTRVLYSGPAPPYPYHHHHPSHLHGYGYGYGYVHGYGHSHGPPPLPPPPPPPPPLLYQGECLHAGIATTGPVAQNPTAPGNWKRLRLFGVNLDCQMVDDNDAPDPPMPDDGSSPSSQDYVPTHHLYPPLLQPRPHGSRVVTAYKEQDINFQRDLSM